MAATGSEAPRLSNTCLNMQSPASCHHPSLGKGDSTAPPVLLEPPHRDSHTPQPPTRTPKSVRPPPKADPAAGRASGEHTAHRLHDLPGSEQEPANSSGRD